MAETTNGYFPDVPLNLSPSRIKTYQTEVQRALNAIEQRREMGPPNGQRLWRSETAPPIGDFANSMRVRYEIGRFLDRMKGQAKAFYFFAPDPEMVEDESLGSVTAQSSIIIPFKESTITDIRVEATTSVTKAFTRRKLTPRSGTYATLRLNGSSQFIDCGSSSTLRPTGDQAVSAWIYLASDSPSPSNMNVIVGNQTNNAAGILFSVDKSTRKLRFATNQAGAQTSGESTGLVTLDAWNHVAVVRSGTGITFYINGAAAGTASGINNPVTASVAFKIGSVASPSSFFYGGMLNDVRFYDSAPNAAEISNIYNGVATPSANLRGWWKITEGTGAGAVVVDSSGYANTGTLNGNPAWVAGEDEITFSAGAQTGTVRGWLIGRRRVIARNNSDAIPESYDKAAADPRSMFPLEILELPT